MTTTTDAPAPVFGPGHYRCRACSREHQRDDTQDRAPQCICGTFMEIDEPTATPEGEQHG